MDIAKISVLSLVAALMCVVLKQYRSEYAFLLSLSASALAILGVLGFILPIISELEAVAEKTAAAQYIKTAFKALGISYIAAFAADNCRDFGQSALAAKAELAGKCFIAMLAWPLLRQVLELSLKLCEL